MVVITGTLATMSRDEAREAARAAGATVTDSVSKKTTLLVVGRRGRLEAAQGAGARRAIVDEDEFRRRLGRGGRRRRWRRLTRMLRYALRRLLGIVPTLLRDRRRRRSS